MSRSLEHFDKVDQKILAILHLDGRTSNSDIAKALGVSEGTVRNRIKKLLDKGAVKFTGLLNPDFLPDRNLVQIGIKVAASKDLSAIAEKISGLPHVISVYIITGEMDIVIEAFVESKFGPIDFIDKQLSSIDGIVSTETQVVMKHYNKWLDLDIA